MVEGIPIKVKIGLRPNGHADHPDWNKLPLVGRGERPEDHQIVKWRYDKTSGHDDETADSPRGQQWGMMIVTETFADEAVSTFPGIVTIMTEAEAQAFWEQKCTAHMPAEMIDSDHLRGLKAQRDLMVALGDNTAQLDARIRKALDPGDVERGVRRDMAKRWTEAKASLGFSIKVRV